MKPFTEVWKQTEQIELVQVHPEEMEPMYKHCFEFKETEIVEIGSAHGASSIVFAEAARQLKGNLICVDTYPENYYGQEGFGKVAREAFRKNVEVPYEDVVSYIGENSEATAQLIGSAQVLFIDGDHSYEGVQKDCQLYLPLLRSGGYVGFHDYNNVAFSGVKIAADDFTAEWPTESVWNLVIRRKP